VRDDGASPRVLVFDPKYKLDGEMPTSEPRTPSDFDVGGRPKKTDIDKMHAYRDAIRDRYGRPVVEYAAILYPGRTVSYSNGLEALRAYPGDAELMDRVRARLQLALLSTNNADTEELG
jgi:hypothetical protein